MDLLLLVVITAVKVLLCKGAALGIILLLFAVKGRRFHYRYDGWARFFRELPAAKVRVCGAAIYLTAAAFSSLASGLLFALAGFRHSARLAVLLFAAGFAVTACRYAKAKDVLWQRYRELPEKFAKESERNDTENE